VFHLNGTLSQESLVSPVERSAAEVKDAGAQRYRVENRPMNALRDALQAAERKAGCRAGGWCSGQLHGSLRTHSFTVAKYLSRCP
jgi:hypothetical protein